MLFRSGDSGKFNQISPVTFAGIEDAELITTEIKHDSFRDLKNIIEITKKQEKQERSTP